MKYLHKDFHGSLSCGFSYVTEKYGVEGFQEYCKEVARNVYSSLSEKIKESGLKALEEHWNNIFTLEEGNFALYYEGPVLVLEVKECPAIAHMKKRGYKIAENFCEHTKLVNEELCRIAGYHSSCDYNQEKGTCIQRFWK